MEQSTPCLFQKNIRKNPQAMCKSDYQFLFIREHAVFSCPSKGCCDGKESDNSYVSVHVAGASEAATVGKEWTCYACGSQLVEDVARRTLNG